MGWRDDLRDASWKGVPFAWKDASTTLDPFIVTHKYPQRRGGWSEPLGLGPDEFEIVGFVLGDDYMSRRDELIRVCKQAGAGTLVHPTLGEKIVVLKPPVRFQESTAEGGCARFTFTFVEEGENKSPTTSALAQDSVSETAAAANVAVSDDFETGFDTLSLDLVIRDAELAVVEATIIVYRVMSAVAEVRATVDRIKNIKLNAVNAVKSLGAAWQNLFSFFHDSAAGGEGSSPAALSALTQIFTALQPAGTPASQQDINRRQLATFIQRQAAITAARTAVAGDYDSRDAAIAARDQAVALLETVRTDDQTRGATFTALTDLRAATVKSMGEKAGTLASVRKVALAQTQPSVVLAYRELGDGARAGEIAASNPALVWNPLFIPSGSEIEVLND